MSMSDEDEGPKNAESNGNLIGAGLILGGLIGAAIGMATGSYGLYVPLGFVGGLVAGLVLHSATYGNPL